MSTETSSTKKKTMTAGAKTAPVKTSRTRKAAPQSTPAPVIEVPAPLAAKKKAAATTPPKKKSLGKAPIAAAVAAALPPPPPAKKQAAAPRKRLGNSSSKKTAAAEPLIVAVAVAVEPQAVAASKPAAKRASARRKPKAESEPGPAQIAPPARYALGAREDASSVFGEHELLDRELGTRCRLSLLGPLAWRCSCERHRQEADCEHGEALLKLLPLEQIAQLDAGWPAREAEVWLVHGRGRERRLQWVAGRGLPQSMQDLALPALDAEARLAAEQAHGWLQALLEAARAEGVPLRVAPEVWTQLAWARDAQGRVARLEPLLRSDAGAMTGLLKQELPAYQWEAALFSVCAGRALIADELGLGQRGAALAAIALWARLFGLSQAWLIAPTVLHAAWRREIERLLGEVPAGLLLAERPPAIQAGAGAPQLLVVDALEQLDDAALQALRGLEQTPEASPLQLLLISHGEPLEHPRLSAWVDWLDLASRGPAARLAALPSDAGMTQQARREALATVLLSRRRHELQQQLPPALIQPLWLRPEGPPPALPSAALKQLRALGQRWQQLQYLDTLQQQQLLQALAQLPAGGSHQVLAAKAEALLALRREWQPAAAARILVCAQSEAELDGLAQALTQPGQKPPLRLCATAKGRATLEAWRAQPASSTPLLLASDAALAAQSGCNEGQGLGEPRLALAHADLPWSAALAQQQRLRLACGPEACGVPVAQLLLDVGGLDRALLAVHQQQQEGFPAWLDGAPLPWLAPEQLAELMPAVLALLAALDA